MAFETSILLAFGAMLAWGIGDFLIQKCTKKIGNIETLAIIGIVGSILLTPFAIKDISLIFSPQNFFLLLSLGIITFIAAIFNFEALKRGKLSIVEVVLEVELPITIALSMIFFHESLSGLQYLMTVLILMGIILIATKSMDHWKAKLEAGVYIAIIASIFMGLVNFLTATGSKNITPIMALWFPWIIFTIICIVVIIRREGFNVFVTNSRKIWILLLFMGIVDTVAWLFYSFSVYSNSISITTAITESYPVIAMFLGLWINKEAIRWHQYIGAGLAIIATIVLAASIS